MPVYQLTIVERHIGTMNYCGVEADTLEDAIMSAASGEVTGYRDEFDFEEFISCSNAQVGESDDELPDDEVAAASKAAMEMLCPNKQTDPPALSPRELHIAFAALKYLRWTHPHSLDGRAFSTDHGRVEIGEVDDLCNKLDVTAKTE